MWGGGIFGWNSALFQSPRYIEVDRGRDRLVPTRPNPNVGIFTFAHLSSLRDVHASDVHGSNAMCTLGMDVLPWNVPGDVHARDGSGWMYTLGMDVHGRDGAQSGA